MRRTITALLAAMLASSALAAPAVSDTPGKTGAGTGFTQPATFDVSSSGSLTELGAPEADARLALVEVGGAADAAAAAVKAWSLWAGHDVPPLRLATPATPRFGWEERVSFAYDTPPNAKRLVAAWAFRRGAAWTVTLFDMPEAIAEKRGAA